MEVITSLENSKVKYWNKLHNKKNRDEEGLFLIEGDHLINEAIKKNIIKELIVLENNPCNLEYPINYVTKDILNKISSMESSPNIMAICHKLEEQELGNKILLLDDIQDPGNLGTIIRSAVAFNYDTVVLSTESVDLYNDKVIRSTEGMLFHLNVIRKDLNNLIPELKKNSYKIYGTKVDGGKLLKEVKISTKFAILIGNEGRGVSNELLKLCDEYTYIPISDICESLNVGVATGIIMYELGGKYNN